MRRHFSRSRKRARPSNAVFATRNELLGGLFRVAMSSHLVTKRNSPALVRFDLN